MDTHTYIYNTCLINELSSGFKSGYIFKCVYIFIYIYIHVYICVCVYIFKQGLKLLVKLPQKRIHLKCCLQHDLEGMQLHST